jgi:signal transduction histidine kinase
MVEYTRSYDPVFSEIELKGVLEQVVNEFGDLFREKRIGVFLDFPEEPVRVSGDTDGIATVFTQLLKSAIRMIGSKQGKVNMSVTPMPQTQEIYIGISDDGQSMPEDVRDALMDSNFSAKTFGAGLGLPLARKIIEAHNGRIELENREEGGNALSIYLPLAG